MYVMYPIVFLVHDLDEGQQLWIFFLSFFFFLAVLDISQDPVLADCTIN